MGTMCQTENGKSSSIVQDTGDFQSAGVVAHELGHRLVLLRLSTIILLFLHLIVHHVQ